MIVWEIIPNLNNRYKISNNGDMYSNYLKKHMKTRMHRGRVHVNLKIKKGKYKYYCVHILVYQTFKGNIPKNKYVYHIDGNVYNNNVNNLKLINFGECKKVQDPPKLPNEIWKDIDGYENRYKISDMGRIYSILTSRLLTLRINSGGYKTTNLTNKNGKQIQKLVHRLVAHNFIGNIPKKKVVDHIDRNKLNNNTTNLRIVTTSENSKNREFKSRYIIQQFDLNGKLLHEYSKMSDILKKYNTIKSNNIYCCLRERSKTSYNYMWKYKNKNNESETIKDTNFKQIGIIGEHDFSNYKINKVGQVINIKTDHLLKHYIHTQYDSISLLTNKKMYRKKIHRLLAHVFIPKGNNEYNVVNHIDENKLNNNLNNLEWTTNKLNIQHSCAKKVKQIDKKTNKMIKIYNSVNDAYRALSKPYGYHIRFVCNKKRKSAFGYKWSW